MIVFTATHKSSAKVFVGSTRSELDFHWAQLVTQAEDGGLGPFLSLLQRDGSDAFEVEEWAHAEEAGELRELMREAQQELAAIPIKAVKSARSGGADSDGRASTNLLQSVLAEISEQTDEDLSEWLQERRDQRAASPSAQTENDAKRPNDTTVVSSGASTKSTLAKVARPRKLASGRTGSAAKEKRIKEAIEQQRQARESHRQTNSTEEAEEMKMLMARMEMRRQAGKKTAKKPLKRAKSVSSAGVLTEPSKDGCGATLQGGQPVAASKLTGSKGTSAQTGPKSLKQASAKISSGRTGSAAKEKRIKEALALEKSEREAEKSSQAASEAAEMAELLSRLDSRTKVAAGYKRRR